MLDEHSNYLNHLNQLRRINAGDDLTDRPGYGLYLVRIPVTLSPGPRSRRGKGAIITVSAKSVMTKHTLRSALRNAVINETVADLTQAIASRSGSEWRPEPGTGHRIILAAGLCRHRALSRRGEHRLAQERGRAPARRVSWGMSRTTAVRGSRNGSEESCESSYHLLEEAATPAKTADARLENRSTRRAWRLDPQARFPANRPGPTPQDERLARHDDCDGRSGPPDEPMEQRSRVVNILSFALRIQAAGVNRRLKQDIADQDPTLNPEALKRISFFEPEPSDEAFQIFQKYVNMKWPLRVYAIEPVIAQQNVADAFSRRKLSAIDLVGSAYAGPLEGALRDRRPAASGR